MYLVSAPIDGAAVEEQKMMAFPFHNNGSWRARPLVVLVATLAVGSISSVLAQPRYAPAEAGAHVGEKATVCGPVASATYAQRTHGQPTFINLDRAYPDQVFTVLVWGDHRSQFPYAPESLMGQQICATGVIKSYRGKPEIVANHPSQSRSPIARTWAAVVLRGE